MNIEKTTKGLLKSALVCSLVMGIVNAKEKKEPNILLIVADDMGYSDLGVTGGEIATPTLDSLAKEGVLMTNFHAAQTCSLTRSMLMTGVDNHLVGLGQMKERKKAPNQKGKEGYLGYLNQSQTVASKLRDSGYNTYMVGKWHLGLKDGQTPDKRGFDKSFALLNGGASHFDTKGNFQPAKKAPYTEDGKRIFELPKDFYSTDFYTDKMISYIENGLKNKKPFFGYVAYTAPHWPLMAPKKYIDKYKGKYDNGYEQLRKDRLEKMKKLGLVQKDFTQYIPNLKTWDSLSEQEKKTESKKMEIYAGMVDNMDYNINRLFNYLKKKGELDNTIIIFMSDNGAAGDNPHLFIKRWSNPKEWLDTYDLSYENMGLKNSYVFYGEAWAQAATAPSKYFKASVTQGGIKVPAIIKLPNGLKNVRSDSFTHIRDITATILDVAKTKDKFIGKREITGKSLLPLVKGEKASIHTDEEFFGWEISGNKAVRKGNWKLVKQPHGKFARHDWEKTNKWELYNLKDDPAEMVDVANKYPKKVKELENAWAKYEKNSGVIEPRWNKKENLYE